MTNLNGFSGLVKHITGIDYSYSALEKALELARVIQKTAGPHKFASTQLQVEGKVLDKIIDLTEMIDEDDLAADGREDTPHITVLYGLHSDDPGEVRQLVERFGPIRATLGKVSLFPAGDECFQRGGDCYDVVKVDVNSPDLARLNSIISQLPHTSNFPIYHPHLTLAYVKPGSGSKYLGWAQLEGTELEFREIIFSSASHQLEAIDTASYPWQENPLYATVEKEVKPSKHKDKSKTIAVDLDGTIAEYDDWVNSDTFGNVREGAVEALTQLHNLGHRIVIWTDRGDTDKVKNYLEQNHVPFGWINESPNQPEGTSAKLIADLYIDDRAIDGAQPWDKILADVLEVEKDADEVAGNDHPHHGDIGNSRVELDVLDRVDFIRLPENVTGTNCSNCEYNTNGICQFHKDDLDLRGLKVTERMCCAEWNAEGTQRPRSSEWENREQVTKGQGEPCKQGETSAKDGCTPLSESSSRLSQQSGSSFESSVEPAGWKDFKASGGILSVAVNQRTSAIREMLTRSESHQGKGIVHNGNVYMWPDDVPYADHYNVSKLIGIDHVSWNDTFSFYLRRGEVVIGNVISSSAMEKVRRLVDTTKSLTKSLIPIQDVRAYAPLIRQPVPFDAGYETLCQLAEQSLPFFQEILSNLDCEIVQLKRITPDTLREAFSPPGLCVIIAPLKSEKRSNEKVIEEYDGDWSRLVDILRASVADDKEREVREAIRRLEESGAVYARPPKDRFTNPLSNGYRDFLANYILPNGFVVEIQFHLKALLVAREEGNNSYHLERSRRDITPRERYDVESQGRQRMDAEFRESNQP